MDKWTHCYTLIPGGTRKLYSLRLESTFSGHIYYCCNYALCCSLSLLLVMCFVLRYIHIYSLFMCHTPGVVLLVVWYYYCSCIYVHHVFVLSILPSSYPALIWPSCEALETRNVMVGPKHTEAPRTPAARKSFSVRVTAGRIVYDEVRHLCSYARWPRKRMDGALGHTRATSERERMCSSTILIGKTRVSYEVLACITLFLFASAGNGA